MNWKKRLLSLAIAAVLTVSMIPAAAAYGKTDDWAEPFVSAMDDLGVIPSSLAKANMTKAISRIDMCRIAVLCYTAVTGETLSVPSEHPFPDTTDEDVEKAYSIGLVAGYDDGTFQPDGTLTRAEAFCFLSTFLKKAGYEPQTTDYQDLDSFSDESTLPDWAYDAARLTVGLGVVVGDGDGLNWAGSITRQEALIMFYQAYLIAEDANSDASDLGAKIAALAQKQVGCKYVYGGKKPTTGFDCSGLVYYVCKEYGYTLNPGATNQWNSLSTDVAKGNLQPGDLVFFSSDGTENKIFHVGIYIGDGNFVHAANAKKGVVITSLSTTYYETRYLGAKRVG